MDKKLLHTVLDAACAEHPYSIAIEDQQTRISYGELKYFSDKVAMSLTGLQVKKDEIVVVYLPASIAYVVSILGINKTGAIFMPLEPDYPPLRAIGLIKETKASTFITLTAYLDSLNEILEKVDELDAANIVLLRMDALSEIQVQRRKGNALGPVVDVINQHIQLDSIKQEGDDTNYVIYTSGSTGQPKIIKGKYKSLSHFIHWEVKAFNLNANTRISLLAPVTFDVSLRDIFAPLLAGGTLCIPDIGIKADPHKLLGWIIESRITLLHIVPSIFRLLTKELERTNKFVASLSLSHILLAGEPLQGKDVLAWYEVVGKEMQLVNLYGPSETVLAKLYHVIDPDHGNFKGIMPLGIPLPNTVIIIENQGELCNEGVVGEILIKTPFISNQYFNDPALNKAKFVQNPLHSDFEDIVYRTGDLGKYLADGVVAFVGRIDNQVKIRGNRVELLEVEAEIGQCPGVDLCVVLAMENADQEKVLVGYFTSENNVSVAQIRGYITPRLPAYMHPSFFLQLDEFPLNLNGKINRKQLPLPEEMLYAKMPFDAPETELELKIAAIWKEVLSLKRISVTNSFYELGGHSLSATKVVSLLYRELGKEITLKKFLQHATIRQLATYFNNLEEKSYDPIPLAPKLQGYPLSNAQNRLFILNQTLQNKSVYNMNGVYKVDARMDINLLQEAFSRIVRRHEILRTVFVSTGGMLVQQVLNDDAVTMIVIEAADMEDEQLQKALLHSAEKEYNLATYPLFDLHLFKCGGKEDILQFTIHHIISDGWSSAIILHEVALLYEQLQQQIVQEKDLLPPLRIQYKDYAYWQSERLSKGEMEHHRQYWTKRLEGKNTKLNLPTDFPQGQLRQYTGEKKKFVISEELSAILRNTALARDTGLFTVLVALTKVWLCRICDQSNVTLGCPVATRSHPDLHLLTGLFLNYLVLYDEVSYERTFNDWLLSIKQTVEEAYEHQEYPYDLIAESVGGQNTSGDIDLYNVLLVMNNSGLNMEREDGKRLKKLMRLEPMPIHDRSSKLPLTLFIDDEPAIGITIEFSIELFSEQTIQAIGERLLQLVGIVVENTHATIGDIYLQLNPIKAFKEIIDEDF
jgi:amino acid adenylation domain-containing protein